MSPVVVFPGRPGAFAEDAALRLAPEGATLRPVPSVPAAFAAIASGAAARAVVAVENSLGGSVGATVDALMTEPVTILAEQQLRIVHVLAGPAGAVLDEVRRVRSHPIAIAQCTRFLAAHPSFEVVPASDTATAAAEVVATRGSPSGVEAAICSPRAARLYGAQVLAADIQDAGDNRTRFLLVGRPGDSPHDAPRATAKTTIVVALPHAPGALASALSLLASRGVNLLRIDARPSRNAPFEYLFQLDLDDTSGTAAGAIDALEGQCTGIRRLGRYAVFP